MSQNGRPPSRKIKSLLIANRAEIATRILSTARTLDLITYTLASPKDDSHTLNSDHVLQLPAASSYMDIDLLISLAKEHRIDACHPGYGFLSESQEFAKRMWDEAGCALIGPGWAILEGTGDKLAARKLAQSCDVPVLPAMTSPSSSIEELRAFAGENGYPIMLKAVDGGGGRGIRLVQSEDELESNAKRAMEESPSKSVFAERAAVSGFRHIEVQIVGDHYGNVRHLWERECSIQRRYQKIVELAPSMIADRSFVARIIESALRIATSIHYSSLGTFEFLVNPETKEFFFLEINPRIQVEHTVTESICNIDLVKVQLELAQGANLYDTGLRHLQVHEGADSLPPSKLHAIQLRLTAENTESNFSLSIGKIGAFHFPSGNGIRVDTHLVQGHEAIVAPDFDSLLAKLIITGPSFKDAVKVSARVLQDTFVTGVKTNIDALRGIVLSQRFHNGNCDTKWLESEIDEVLHLGSDVGTKSAILKFAAQNSSTASASLPGMSSSTMLLRKGDAWNITLGPVRSKTSSSKRPREEDAVVHHLKIRRILQNELPSSLSAEIAYSTPGQPPNSPSEYTVQLTATSSSAESAMSSSKHRRGDKSNPAHITIPLAGKLVEIRVEEGDTVKAGDAIAFVEQMKMQVEVRAGSDGRVKWVTEAKVGEDVAEGMLAAELEVEDQSRAKL